MKRVRRWMPYEVSQYHETEQWLERKAAQGLHFIDCRLGLAAFERGERKTVRYRLEFAHRFFAPEPEQQELYKEMGWEYVTNIRNDYFVFRTEDPEAPELHTEEGLLAEDVKQIYRKQLALGRTLAFLLPLFVVYILLYGILLRGPLWAAACYGTWGPLLLALCPLFFAAQVIRNVVLAQRFKRGVQTKRTLLPLRPYWLAMACLVVGMLCLYKAQGMLFQQLNKTPPEELPVPTLAEIDPAAYGELTEVLAIHNDPDRLGAYWESGRDFSCINGYGVRRDLLVSRTSLEQHYELHPYYEGSHMVEVEQEAYYRVDTYDCLTAGMARALAELLRTEKEDRVWETVEEGAVWTAEDECQRLLLCSGRRVWQVTYLGEAELLSFLPAFQERM
ncbi:MAG: DUF2812 domain-containing protein [Oscillospiraceae bacterium]